MKVYQLIAKGSYEVLSGSQVLRSKVLFKTRPRAEEAMPNWLDRINQEEHPLAGRFIVELSRIDELEVEE